MMFGKIVSSKQEGNVVTIQFEKRSGRIEVITKDIINVFAAFEGEEHNSFAIEGNKVIPCEIKVTQEKDHILISTDSLTLKVYDDFKVDLYDKNGVLLCEDSREGRRLNETFDREAFLELIASEGHDVQEESKLHTIEVIKKMQGDEAFYSLGDKTGFLNKRSYEFENWNSDLPQAHNEDFKALYKSIPFFITLRENGVFGLFFDNHYKSYFDMGKEQLDYYYFAADKGNLDYYMIGGSNMAEVVSNYTYLTGTTPLPQKFTLGYQQSRWSYETRKEVEELAANMRKYNIPCDVIHLDIDYMKDYKVFTWNDKTFPNPKEMMDNLKENGFKIVTILDPGTKVEDGYFMYEEGKEKGYFATDENGEIYVNQVWPGDAVFPDFSSEEVRNWWADHEKDLIDTGVSGIWNDMNEPASFRGPLPLDVQFAHGEKTYTHEELHNVYGSLMSKAAHDGLEKHDKKRPFVITRACYAGIQKYSTVWTGDNQSLWHHLQMAIPQLCNLGLSGVAFAGTDVGGFGADVTKELLIRWVQVGCFSPLFRNHCAKAQRRQEPWTFDEECLDIYRKYVKLRYHFLPYFYDLFAKGEKTGLPVMRPLVLQYEKDSNVKDMNDQFLVGDSILVAPILEQGKTKRMVYLPQGEWVDYHTKEVIKGGQYILKDAPLSICPIYIKSGSVIPVGPEQNYVGEVKEDILVLECFGENGSYVHYQDNGEDFAYREGEYNAYEITMKAGKVTAKQIHSGYEKAYKGYQVIKDGAISSIMEFEK